MPRETSKSIAWSYHIAKHKQETIALEMCVDRDERKFVVLYVVEKCGNAAEFEEQVGGC